MSKVIEKAELTKAPAPLADEMELPVPPVPPCTPEEYDEWFRAKVQEALDDPNPVYYSMEEANAMLDAIIERKRRERDARERPRS